ncbi:MAG TPA: hypothetical protein VMV05_03970 [bacterium]|nr:hypothetical protein [bacterium]
MNDVINDRNKFKKLFSNTTSRSLLGVWLMAKGSRYPIKALTEIVSIPEDALEAKFQTFAGMGLVHVFADAQGERLVEFLPPPTPDLEKMIWELFDGRKTEYDAVEMKMRSLTYKTLMTMTL